MIEPNGQEEEWQSWQGCVTFSTCTPTLAPRRLCRRPKSSRSDRADSAPLALSSSCQLTAVRQQFKVYLLELVSVQSFQVGRDGVQVTLVVQTLPPPCSRLLPSYLKLSLSISGSFSLSCPSPFSFLFRFHFETCQLSNSQTRQARFHRRF